LEKVGKYWEMEREGWSGKFGNWERGNDGKEKICGSVVDHDREITKGEGWVLGKEREKDKELLERGLGGLVWGIGEG
jgi:hypothetical protein